VLRGVVTAARARIVARRPQLSCEKSASRRVAVITAIQRHGRRTRDRTKIIVREGKRFFMIDLRANERSDDTGILYCAIYDTGSNENTWHVQNVCSYAGARQGKKRNLTVYATTIIVIVIVEFVLARERVG
jgi:hypothetical protein